MTQTQIQNIVEYNGTLTFPIVDELLLQAKKQLLLLDIDVVIQKRIYAILVESLENAYRHKATADYTLTNRSCIEMKLFTQKNQIVLQLGNYISNSKIDFVVEKIDKINTLNLEALNKLYRSSIANARISDKGGAGLGMIEIARNSRHQIKYQLIKENSEISFIIFEIRIAKHFIKE